MENEDDLEHTDNSSTQTKGRFQRLGIIINFLRIIVVALMDLTWLNVPFDSFAEVQTDVRRVHCTQ